MITMSIYVGSCIVAIRALYRIRGNCVDYQGIGKEYIDYKHSIHVRMFLTAFNNHIIMYKYYDRFLH